MVQEAHLRFFDYRRSRKVRDEDSLLRRIVINLSITHFHREQSTPFIFDSVEELDRRGMLLSAAPSPERTLVGEQQLDRVAEVLGAVSPRTCQIFIAQRVGYSYEEVATAFSIKPRTVDKHVTCAVQTLTEMMAKDFAGRP